jgi:Ca2+-binding RTX toxin-like protein
VVDVLGTDNADQFIATHLGGNQWSVSLNGNTVFNGTVFSSGMLRIDGRQGADGLQINGTSGADSFVVLDDRTNLNGLDIFQVQVENRSVWGLGADDTFRLQSPLQGAYGGAGRDRFMLPDSSVLVGTLDAGADYDTLDYSLRTGPITYTVGSTSSVGVTQMSGIESIIGSQALDTLIGQNQLTDWGIYGADLVQINLVDYSSFENLQGGTNVDRFQLWNGSARVSGTVHGGTGADRLTAFNLANTWQLSGSKSGSIQGLVTFSDIEALFGGSAEDRFNVQLGSAFSSIDGAGGQDECNFGSYNSAVSVSLATSSMTALGLFSSIETIVGSNQTDSITAGNGSNAWTITGSGAGQLGSIQFTSFEIARGGSGADTFQIQSGGIPIIFGGLGTDTIIGPNQTNSWRLSAAAAGVLNSTTTFREMENVTGGRGDDTVEVTSSGTLSGTLSGGEGVNTLTYQSLPSNRVAEINVLANRSTGISNLASNFQVLIGGAGNDKLIAFAGVATVLVGNAGDDELTGSTARDILIGGVGADKLWGGGGEDILIAGSSSHDANAVPLIAIRNEWNSSRTYNERIGNIRGNAINGTPLNDSYYLRGGSGGSLQGDSSIDTLFGQADQDWFIAESNDLLSDRLANELLQNPLSN